MVKMCKRFAFSMLKITTARKKNPTAGCVVGTNISYVSYNEIEIQIQIQIYAGCTYSLSYKEIVLVVVQKTDTISILSDTIAKYIL